MKKVFWENPYQTQLNTKVTAVDGDRVLLDETIAFSFCGGQESDAGQIGGLPILSSEIVDTLIYYTLPADHTLKAGDPVYLEINWKRRYKLMRLHFAAELILEIVTHKLNLEKIGAHISEEKSRIDFFHNQNISSHFPEILAEYNQIIERDLPIKKGYTDEATQRRYWEIEGFSKVSCGGTHVKSTAEVGLVNLKRVNIGGGKERIEIKLQEPDRANPPQNP